MRRILLLGLCALFGAAPAFAFPDRPIRMVVPFSAGGATDVGARVLAEAMAPHLPQPIVIENRVGGAGIVASELVARAAADGVDRIVANTPEAAAAYVSREVARWEELLRGRIAPGG